MKRLIICAALFLGAIAVSLYTYVKVEKVGESLNLRIDALTAVLYEGDIAEITEQSRALAEFWDVEERSLVHFVRHSHIDLISISISRLPALAEYGDYSEVFAELLGIRRQMRHIRSSEKISLDNLF